VMTCPTLGDTQHVSSRAPCSCTYQEFSTWRAIDQSQRRRAVPRRYLPSSDLRDRWRLGYRAPCDRGRFSHAILSLADRSELAARQPARPPGGRRAVEFPAECRLATDLRATGPCRSSVAASATSGST